MSTLTVPQLTSYKLNEDIQDGILTTLFGSESTNVKTLLQTTSQITPNVASDYEFEIRLAESTNFPHVTKEMWTSFFEHMTNELTPIAYSDDLVYTYLVSIPLVNIRFRRSQNSQIFERKMLINEVKARPNGSTTPMVIKLSKESTMSPTTELTHYTSVQRRQRISYKFNSPHLSGWRVDATVRLFAHNIKSNKLTIELDHNNLNNPTIFDLLDIEFEYIGEFNNLSYSFFRLIQLIYTPFESFNILYLLTKSILSTVVPTDMINVNNIVNMLPKPTILTNDVLQTLNIENYTIVRKTKGTRAILVLFHDTASTCFAVSCEKLVEIHGSLHNIDNMILIPTVSNVINSMLSSGSKLYIPNVTMLDVLLINNTIIITDVIIYDNKAMTNETHTKRVMKPITQLVDEIQSNWLTGTKWTVEGPQFVHPKDWATLINSKESYICKPIDQPLLSSTIYKLSYHKHITFNFKIIFVPIKNVFYLYTIGKPSQSIESKTVNNRYSTEHFGYTIVTSPNMQSAYMLYASPYMRDSYILTERACDEMPELYREPIKYSGRVIKVMPVNGCWKPIEVTNNTEPDTYTDALKMESLLFNPLHREIYEPNRQLLAIKPIYTTTYDLLNQYVIEKFTPLGAMILDITDDNTINGNNFFNLVSARSVCTVSESKHCLTTFIERSTDKTFKANTVLPYTRLRLSSNLQFDTQIINAGVNSFDVIDKLNKKWNYVSHSMDIMFVENTNKLIHSMMDIIHLRRIAENVLTPNGIIVIKLFEGNKLEEMIKKAKPVDVNKSTRRITKTKLNLKFDEIADKFTYEPRYTSRPTKRNPAIPLTHTDINNYDFTRFSKTDATSFERELNDLTELTKLSIEALSVIVNVVKITIPMLFINEELFGHPYTRTLKNSYQLDDSTDIINDNDAYPVNNIIVNVNRPNSVETALNEYVIKRKGSQFSTVVVNPTNVNIFDDVLTFSNDVTIGIVWPNFVTKDDIRQLKHMFTAPDFQMYESPDFFKVSFEKSLIIRQNYLNFLAPAFKPIDVVQPVTQTEIATFISSNRQFSQFELIDNYFSAFNVYVFGRA